jgi:hypothetical protein
MALLIFGSICLLGVLFLLIFLVQLSRDARRSRHR